MSEKSKPIGSDDCCFQCSKVRFEKKSYRRTNASTIFEQASNFGSAVDSSSCISDSADCCGSEYFAHLYVFRLLTVAEEDLIFIICVMTTIRSQPLQQGISQAERISDGSQARSTAQNRSIN